MNSRCRRPITLGSLFDGIGVFPLAGALHGITPVWASEIDPAAIAVTSARFPKMQHLCNILEVHGGKIPPVDIITGGSPCQNLSPAGDRTGLAGEKSGLFMEMVRVIREMRQATGGRYPRFVVWENVAGALNSNKGADFAKVLKEIAALAGLQTPDTRPAKWAECGWIVADGVNILGRVLNARYWGVPQNRLRVFVTADFRPECWTVGEMARERGSVRGDTPSDAEAELQSTGRDDRETETAGSRDVGAWDEDSPEYEIGNGVPWRLLRRAAEYGDVPPVSVAIPEWQSFFYDTEAKQYTSTKSYFQAVYRLDNIGALTACDYKDPPIVMTKYKDGGWGRARRLSPKECLRLQGLPSTWCNTDPVLKDKDIYRLAGNSIVLPCAEHIMAAVAGQVLLPAEGKTGNLL